MLSNRVSCICVGRGAAATWGPGGAPRVLLSPAHTSHRKRLPWPGRRKLSALSLSSQRASVNCAFNFQSGFALILFTPQNPAFVKLCPEAGEPLRGLGGGGKAPGAQRTPESPPGRSHQPARRVQEGWVDGGHQGMLHWKAVSLVIAHRGKPRPAKGPRRWPCLACCGLGRP